MLGRITKNDQRFAKNICVIFKHPYFQSLDYNKFTDGFDSVIEFPYVDYYHNLFKGFTQGYKFRKLLNGTKITDSSLVFTPVTSDLGINLFIKRAKKKKINKNKVVALSWIDKPNMLGKRSLLSALWNHPYSLFLGGYYVYNITGENGHLIDREYFKEPYDYRITIAPPDNNRLNDYSGASKDLKLPYPIFNINPSENIKAKIVIFWGDASSMSFKFYPGIDQQLFFERTNRVLSELRNKYLDKGIVLYYKPHPLCESSVEDSRLDISGFQIFKERFNVEMICSLYRDNIIATYSVFSASCPTSSYFGIPSYHLYDYCVSDGSLKKRFEEFFKSANPDLLKKIRLIEDIGSIDKNKVEINDSIIKEEWLKAIGGLKL
jgi:hypothetical protein